jgi:hypothetical protein
MNLSVLCIKGTALRVLSLPECSSAEINLSVLRLTGTALLVLSLPEGSSTGDEPGCTLSNRASPAGTLST